MCNLPKKFSGKVQYVCIFIVFLQIFWENVSKISGKFKYLYFVNCFVHFLENVRYLCTFLNLFCVFLKKNYIHCT